MVIGAGLVLLLAAFGWWLSGDRRTAPRGLLVLAAASMQGPLDEAAAAWAAKGHAAPVTSYAASSAIARQAMSGAQADILITADRDWMDRADQGDILTPGSRADLLANRIVLIAPRGARLTIDLASGATLSRALGGERLALADPDSVPAGRYGRAALESLGLWDAVEGRIVRAENVRAALALVERGAAPLGIVYATDAAQSDRVRVVATFDPALHPPIRYPIARLRAGRSEDAAGFRDFLLADEAQAIFARYGFTRP